MACDCITLRFGFYILESNNYREGRVVLTSTNNYGNFVNGQPYWQFTESEVFGNVPDGFNIEISQLNGAGAWRIYIIDNVGVPANSGLEVLRQKILLEPPQDCPDFIKYKAKPDTPITNFAGFQDVSNQEGFDFFARTECCADTNGAFYFYFYYGPLAEDYYYALFNIPNGDYNSYPYWQIELLDENNLGTGLFVQLSRSSDDRWVFYWINSLNQDPSIAGIGDDFYEYMGDPFSVYPEYPADLIGYTNWWQISTVISYPTVEFGNTWGICEIPPTCIVYQNRTKKEYPSIKLPEIFEEENRGYFRCCCEAIVLADQTSSDTWKNDVTSAWIKLSDVLDTASFDLYKDNTLATYQPTQVTFARESLGRYVTIPWQDVLNTDGAGCYRLDITFTIAGVNQTFTWGKYKLKPYSIQNALETARVKAIFNAYNEIEQIDFRDSKVEDTLRFYGFIGNAQPNMEIDNIIYDNREMKKVIRENLNTYEIITDPICEEFTKSLKDLYLLSENELFISDYNAHNHSYRYQDLPVIVTESPEIEYYDFSREAKLTCIVGDKFKNKRSYYK